MKEVVTCCFLCQDGNNLPLTVLMLLIAPVDSEGGCNMPLEVKEVVTCSWQCLSGYNLLLTMSAPGVSAIELAIHFLNSRGTPTSC